jgi:hypothetical protein
MVNGTQRRVNKRHTLKILPREPLTKKAKAAISQYAHIRAQGRGGSYSHFCMVDYVLRAERMRRADLYAFLEERGYRWKKGTWIKSARSKRLTAAPKSIPAPNGGGIMASRKPAATDPDSLTEAELIDLIRAGAIPVKAAK